MTPRAQREVEEYRTQRTGGGKHLTIASSPGVLAGETPRSGSYLSVLVGLCVFLPPSLGAAGIVWTNTAGGNWTVPANWQPNQVPTSTDAAIITNAGTYTVTLNANSSVESLLLGGVDGGQALTMNGAGLTVNGLTAIRSNGLVTIFGGTLGGSGGIVVDGTLNVFGGSFLGSEPLAVAAGGQLLFSGDVNFGGRPLQNSGSFIWASGNITNASAVINSAGGVVDILVSNNVFSGNQVFTNAGVLRRTFGTSTVTFNVPFNNQGVLQIQSGTVALTRAGIHAGSFTIGPNATLQIGTGLFPGTSPVEFTASSSVTGAGNVILAGLPMDINGTFYIGGATVVNGGTVNFGTGYILSNSPIAIVTASTANFNSGRMLAPSRFELSGGTLAGADSMTVTGLVQLYLGTLQSAGTINANGGFVASYDVTMLSGTLNTLGYSILTGALRLWSNSVLNNLPGATLHYAGGWFGQPGRPGRFNNYGLLLKSGAGLWGIAVPFYNYGEVEVQGGRFFLSEGGVHSGSFHVAAGASLEFQSGFFQAPHALLIDSRITGDGNVVSETSIDALGPITIGGNLSIKGGTNRFTGFFTNGGTINFSGGVASFDTGNSIRTKGLTVSSGTLAGGDPMIVDGLTTWTGGTLSGKRVITANGGLTLAGSTLLLDGCTLNNTAIANWNGGFIFTGGGSLISNAPSGTFNITFDGQTFAGFGGSRRFFNAGLLRKTGSAGTAVVSDGFYNFGTIEALSGDLLFGNSFLQTGGSTLLKGGNLGASGPLQITGGVLGGSGVINANVLNSSHVAPGLSAGLLRIAGNYTQTSGGHLDLEVGGSIAGNTFDQLQVDGAASLAGSLNVSLNSGFHAGLGDTFRVLTFASRSGDFTVFNDTTGSDLHRIYDSTGLTLAASNSAPALVITRQTNQQIVISWSSDASGYVLQSALNLPSTNWVTISANGTNSIVLPATPPPRFFRLIKP
jgi:hypothetical protein